MATKKPIRSIKSLAARERADEAYDRKHKIAEGSKRDVRLDKKNGVPETRRRGK